MRDYDQTTIGPEPLPEITDYFGIKPLWTPEIGRVSGSIAQLMSSGTPGALVWGLQHCGKTYFTKYLADILPLMLRAEVKTFFLDFSGFKIKGVNELLQRCLVCVGSTNIAARDRTALQQRLVTQITKQCESVQAQRALLVVDDVQNIPHVLYEVISSITADLTRQRGIRAYVLSVGQPEMVSSLKLVEDTNFLQIKGRFFPVVVKFRALSMEEVREFLVNMDGPDLAFTRRVFPIRAEASWSIADLAVPIEMALDAIRDGHNLTSRPRLPMRYLSPALSLMFRYLSQSADAFVDKDVAVSCFEGTGFRDVVHHYVDAR